MACIKDLENYSNENLKSLQKELENIDFKARAYAKEPSTAVCGFILSIKVFFCAIPIIFPTLPIVI